MPAPEPVTKDSFQKELERLVDNFAANEDEYTSPGYPEAQARTDFITPLFRALGWDTENRAGLPYTKREVVEEKGPGEGRPDYTFRIGGVPKFMVEAKAPHEHLDNERHVMQVKRYAWSTMEVFAAILTDFEEFRFYDASQQPDPNHAHRGLIYDFRYNQYLKNLDKLWEFSRDRVAAGSIEALLPRDRLSLRFRKPPDETFLEDMFRWRKELAAAVFKRNPDLEARELTEIVQRLLDRLIFIRVAEDREILPSRRLWDRVQEWKAIGGRKPLLPMLNELFHQVNRDFNGDIFKYHRCEEIELHDWALGDIIEELYPPRGLYRFDAISVDIFGAVYERYLGKTIYVSGKGVKVDDKPEVRKAGGVYYTPKYIVDYIVKNTVGKVVEGKTPKEIEKIRILDPACGSGSFLLGAFQYLIDYHVEYADSHPKEPFSGVVKEPDGVSRLNIWRKAKILSHNLYGVDIDPQAVEITMMNLYLKALEGEHDLPRNKAVLPELSANIRCGNSLIAPDIAKEQKLSEEEWRRLNPFDWHSETDAFGHILKAGGFDAVIGNPPYVRIQTLRESSPATADYLQEHYDSAKVGNFDIYVVFLEKALELINSNGFASFILPNKFMHMKYGEGLRKKLSDRKAVAEIIDFVDSQVFDHGSTYTCILRASKPPKQYAQFARVRSAPDKLPDALSAARLSKFPADNLTNAPWTLGETTVLSLYHKCTQRYPTLGQLSEKIFQGVITGADPVFLFEHFRQVSKRLVEVESKASNRRVRLEASILKPVVRSGQIGRYWQEASALVLFPYYLSDTGPSLIPESHLRSRFPKAWAYLMQHKKRLAARERGRFKRHWYTFSRSQNLDCWSQHKLMLPYMVTRLAANFDTSGAYFVNVTTGGYGLSLKTLSLLKLICGLLNSKLVNFFLAATSSPFRGGYFAANKQFLEKLPIAVPNLDDPTQKAQHDNLIHLVDRMLDVMPRLRKAKNPTVRQALQQQAEATDRKIDELVYDLYGVTDEERRIIGETT